MQDEPQKDTDRDAKILVTKLDAARRQLRTAIKLWFEDADPVSVHTLVAASYNVIHNLYRRKGLTDLIYDSRLVKDERRKEWVNRVKSDFNFFKHSDKDPDETILFSPFTNEFFIVFCITAIQRMGEPLDVEGSGFAYWTFINRPEMLIDSAYDNVPVDTLQDLRRLDKIECFTIHKANWRQP